MKSNLAPIKLHSSIVMPLIGELCNKFPFQRIRYLFNYPRRNTNMISKLAAIKLHLTLTPNAIILQIIFHILSSSGGGMVRWLKAYDDCSHILLAALVACMFVII